MVATSLGTMTAFQVPHERLSLSRGTARPKKRQTATSCIFFLPVAETKLVVLQLRLVISIGITYLARRTRVELRLYRLLDGTAALLKRAAGETQVSSTVIAPTLYYLLDAGWF
jgi:hypothetical protein